MTMGNTWLTVPKLLESLPRGNIDFQYSTPRFFEVSMFGRLLAPLIVLLPVLINFLWVEFCSLNQNVFNCCSVLPLFAVNPQLFLWVQFPPILIVFLSVWFFSCSGNSWQEDPRNCAQTLYQIYNIQTDSSGLCCRCSVSKSHHLCRATSIICWNIHFTKRTSL